MSFPSPHSHSAPDEDDDPIIFRFPVFLAPAPSPLYCVQSPLRPPHRPYIPSSSSSSSPSPPVQLSVKPAQKLLSLSLPLQISSTDDNDNNIPSPSPSSTPLLLLGKCVPPKTNYAIGSFSPYGLVLNPVHATCRLRPDLAQTDEMNAKIAIQKNNTHIQQQQAQAQLHQHGKGRGNPASTSHHHQQQQRGRIDDDDHDDDDDDDDAMNDDEGMPMPPTDDKKSLSFTLPSDIKPLTVRIRPRSQYDTQYATAAASMATITGNGNVNAAAASSSSSSPYSSTSGYSFKSRSYVHLKSISDAEPWIPLTYFPPHSPESSMERRKLFPLSSNSRILTFNIPPSQLIKYINISPLERDLQGMNKKIHLFQSNQFVIPSQSSAVATQSAQSSATATPSIPTLPDRILSLMKQCRIATFSSIVMELNIHSLWILHMAIDILNVICHCVDGVFILKSFCSHWQTMENHYNIPLHIQQSQFSSSSSSSSSNSNPCLIHMASSHMPPLPHTHKHNSHSHHNSSSSLSSSPSSPISHLLSVHADRLDYCRDYLILLLYKEHKVQRSSLVQRGIKLEIEEMKKLLEEIGKKEDEREGERTKGKGRNINEESKENSEISSFILPPVVRHSSILSSNPFASSPSKKTSHILPLCPSPSNVFWTFKYPADESFCSAFPAVVEAHRKQMDEYFIKLKAEIEK